MRNLVSAGFGRYFMICAALLMLLTLAGCPKPQLSGSDDSQGQQTIDNSSLIRSSIAAFNSKDFRQALNISSSTLQRADLETAQKQTLTRIYTLSLTQLDPGGNSLKALEQWRLDELAFSGKMLDATNEWINAWTFSMNQLSDNAVANEISKILNDPARPWQIRTEASMYSSERLLKSSGPIPFTESLESGYTPMQISRDRIMLEQRLFSFMHRVDNTTLSSLVQLVDEYNEKFYPYAIFKLEQARRLNLSQSTRQEAEEIMGYLKQGSQLADTGIFRRWMDPDTSALSGLDIVSTEMALVLPLSGQYGNLAAKVASGANIACKLISVQGKHVRLYIIDSDQPNWTADIAKLPSSVLVIGGPMRNSDYVKIKEAGLLSQRYFFAFMPRLPVDDEGVAAWRFFSSDQDQAKAVIRFAKNVGVNSFACLSPAEPYGERMSTAFSAAVYNEGGNLVKSGQYPVKLYKEWSNTIAGFLGTSKGAGRAPSTPYKAIYLPDSWNEASMIIPYFHYYRETRLLLMGSSLWEQSISADPNLDYTMFRNAIFPGAWDPNTSTAAGQAIRTAVASGGISEADFWYALGYDFINLATTLNIHAMASPQEVNFALTQINTSRWSGAPISWSEKGIAQQDLYVFTMTEDGISLADPATFQNRMTKLWGY